MILCCGTTVQAQNKNFEYVDTSLNATPPEEVTKSTIFEEENTTSAEGEKPDILSDTTLYINRISLSQDSVSKWKNDKRFAYLKILDSLLKQREKEKPADKDQPVGNPSRENTPSFAEKLLSTNIVQAFFWIIAIAFVVFILLKLFLSNGIFRNGYRSLPVDELPPGAEQLVAVSDFDRLIHQACKLGDYRIAVRYLFLKNLARLAEKEYLHLSADKTNYQYVQEIAEDKKNDFSALVLTYEYVWYGNFSLKQETYTVIEKKFSTFYHKI